MGSGSLRHASTVTALLCSTKGTAPGEPIKSVRCAGDSCSSRSPESLPAPHHWWGNTVEVAGNGRRWNTESQRGRKDQWQPAVNLKASRDHGKFERNPYGEWEAMVWLQVVFSQSHLHYSTVQVELTVTQNLTHLFILNQDGTESKMDFSSILTEIATAVLRENSFIWNDLVWTTRLVW